jgi:hypothetical protein
MLAFCATGRVACGLTFGFAWTRHHLYEVRMLNFRVDLEYEDLLRSGSAVQAGAHISP